MSLDLSYTKSNRRKFYLTLSREREMEDALTLVSYFSSPILDIGASEGKTYRIFKKLGLSNEYIMTELDKKLVLTLKRRFPAANVVQCSASYLPFRKNSVNTLSLNVINWKPIDQERHLFELERISKEIFVISLYSKLKSFEEFKQYLKFSRKLVKYCKENFMLFSKYEDEIGILDLYVKIKNHEWGRWDLNPGYGLPKPAS